MRTVRLDPDWDAFRRMARRLLREGVAPDRVNWEEADAAGQISLLSPAAPTMDEGDREPTARVPRRYLQLGPIAACHRDPPAWPTLYRLLWRITDGERDLLDDAADPDVVRLTEMERAVRRDAHKMKAFVRFRSLGAGGSERFVAWFEPRHRIVRWTAPFFQRRFPSMRWSILTPDECVHWDGEELAYSEGVDRSAAPEGDDLEAFWLTYYTHTFNPARLRVNAMRAEMPVYYWKNLPEAGSISGLLRDAPGRVREMIDRAGSPPPASPERAAPPAPAVRRVHEPPADLAPLRVPGFRIGVAGWDYPDWAGLVYPEGREGVDRLRWVSARFDLLEVNSTFYRPVSERAAHSWLERTTDRPELRFTAKLVRTFTHHDGPWKEADVEAVRRGMSVLMEDGRLTSLVVQFPWSFRNRPTSRTRLKRITDAFADFPLHVEVRHASWEDGAFFEWLRSEGIGFVNIDQPIFQNSLMPTAEATSRTGYLRLHGRNAADWFREDAGRDERYDYSYSKIELEPWIDRALQLHQQPDVEEVEIVFNNHYRAQAVNNAETFAEILSQRS